MDLLERDYIHSGEGDTDIFDLVQTLQNGPVLEIYGRSLFDAPDGATLIRMWRARHDGYLS